MEGLQIETRVELIRALIPLDLAEVGRMLDVEVKLVSYAQLHGTSGEVDEGFEASLTLHRLGVLPLVGRSLETTNVLESVNAQAETGVPA